MGQARASEQRALLRGQRPAGPREARGAAGEGAHIRGQRVIQLQQQEGARARRGRACRLRAPPQQYTSCRKVAAGSCPAAWAPRPPPTNTTQNKSPATTHPPLLSKPSRASIHPAPRRPRGARACPAGALRRSGVEAVGDVGAEELLLARALLGLLRTAVEVVYLKWCTGTVSLGCCCGGSGGARRVALHRRLTLYLCTAWEVAPITLTSGSGCVRHADSLFSNCAGVICVNATRRAQQRSRHACCLRDAAGGAGPSPP